jgi:hypothetical protein
MNKELLELIQLDAKNNEAITQNCWMNRQIRWY